MRILFHTLYYWPEPTASGPVVAAAAEYLARRGWQVDVLTGMPKMPRWEVYEGYRHRWIVREQRNGVNIVRSFVWVPARPSGALMKTWKRALFDSSIALTSFPCGALLQRPDVIVSITPPLQLAAAAIALGRIWQCPVLNWLHDIVPDAAIDVGMMREGFLVKVARQLENFVYRNVDRIACISGGILENLESKGVPREKLTLLTNFAEMDRFSLPTTNNRETVRRQWGIGTSDFVLLHAGSLSPKQVMENVVRAMSLLSTHDDIHCLIVGDGLRKAAVQAEIEALHVPRCRVLPFTHDEDYVDSLRAADVLIVNQNRGLIDTLVPSKLLTYLPSGRPVLAAVNRESDAARFVRESGAGVVVEPENPKALADAVLDMKCRPAELDQMGMAGHAYVRDNLDKEIVLARFERELNALILARNSS